jgi:3-hydroxyisobutyrate dehydrogenase-like beta-hydroxyacid dehydrogenase
MTSHIGFIGLGTMGSRMAANVRAHGYELTVFNRTRDRADALLRAGARWAASPAALAAEAEVLFTMLPDPAAVSAAALGDGGFLRAMQNDTIWVNCGTVNPSFARDMAAAARSNRIRYVDAPVAGSKAAAQQAELLFMVGADSADLEACRPLLTCMSKRIVHVGTVGQGSALKMVNNLLIAVAMEAFAEGAALGQAFGIGRDLIFDTLVGGPIVAPFIAAKRPRIDRHDYEDADFSLRLIEKDLHLAALSGYEAGVAMPLVGAANEIYRLAMRHGLADQDFAAIYAFLNDAGAAAAGPTGHDESAVAMPI